MWAAAEAIPAVHTLLRGVEKGGVLSLAGLAAPAQPFLAALLSRLAPRRPVVVVTDGVKTQETFQQDVETWLAHGGEVQGPAFKDQRDAGNSAAASRPPASRPLFFPEWEILPHEDKLPHADVIGERLETLAFLARDIPTLPRSRAPLIVTNAVALMQRTFAPDALRARVRTLRRGDRVNPLDLIEWLEEQAYEPEAQVTQKGEVAWRGGIVDVFPLTSPWPVRLEFFGEELESLRQFDPLSQMSREEIDSVTLPPAGELGLLKRMRNADLDRGRRDAECGTRNGTGGETASASLMDHLPKDTILLVCEPAAVEERVKDYAARVGAEDPFHADWFQLLAKARSGGLTVIELSETEPEQPLPTTGPASSADDSTPRSAFRAPHFQSLDAWRPLADRPPEPQVAEAQRREFFHQLHRWLRQGFAVHVFCNNDGERQRFTEVWEEYGLGSAGQASSLSCISFEASRSDLPLEEGSSTEPAQAGSSVQGDRLDACPALHLGALSRGFLCEEAKLVVVTDAEVFGRYKVQRPRRLKSPHAVAARSLLDIDFSELEPGDFIVHLQHGIGRYAGLQTIPATVGRQQSAIRNPQSAIECLVIEYAPREPGQPPPRLYVPVTEAHLVSKYVGAGKARPQLGVLGGGRWAKTKEQAERAVRDLAGELLAIQAARESLPGHAFGPDSPWQREFESAFIFEETPDQLRAIVETKTDMERPKPMDRLICGDVGFGKTEVAMRAAFKAVMGGKQAAILVPTTVLAQQHFNTFRERMADYPVRIELLSRFRGRRRQQRVVQDLARGAVDIVIGTHRLLQDDIAFKDLGLVVIDEEQRFGVMHKEKFKQLRKLVDVLTLSATPIPRTLYLALTGARDMSTIQTPPHDRLPVETIVAQYDERLIRDAIQRELNRGGQVFFLHNRVMTIDLMADKLKTLLPDARIVVGHGQMHAEDLEEVMTRFVNGEADVLLSTTIIESGLDIPNANTILIDRADRFGLSELYQLRGRVGRYKHQAYAYFLLPRHARLLTDVRKRMSAMKQYAQPGSGFKIAMRDLEIRGAGNLLGPEQSGHITAVGFDLYCQLLKQSVASLKGEKVKPRLAVTARLDFLDMSVASNGGAGSPLPAGGEHGVASPASAGLPHNYIPEPQHRIDIYRKLAQAADKESLAALKAELRDRFGPLPKPVELLLLVTELKLLAAERQVTTIETQDDRLMLTRNDDYIQVGGRFPRLTKKTPEARLKEIRKLLLALH